MKRKFFEKTTKLVVLFTLLLQSFAPVMSVAAEEFSPFIGDINFDISIREVSSTVSAGNEANFILEVRSTGSVIEYNDVTIDIDLPSQDVATFNQNLNELMINGVAPVYDQANNRLTYNFATLPTGHTYQVLLRLNTIDGTTLDQTRLDVVATASGAQIPANTVSTASVRVTSSSNFNVSKRLLNSNGSTPSIQGDDITWQIEAFSTKNLSGNLFLQEGSQITIVDTLPVGLTYVSDNAGGVYNPTNRTVTWTFDAPTLLEQQQTAAGSRTFSETINLVTTIDTDVANFTRLENTISANASSLSGDLLSSNASSSVLVSNSLYDNVIFGSWYPPSHSLPTSSVGTTTQNQDGWFNQRTFYDSAYLAFGVAVAPKNIGRTGDFQSYIMDYTIDPNLHLDELHIAGDQYRINRGVNDPLGNTISPNQPEIALYLMVNGVWEQKVDVVPPGINVYTREQLGLAPEDRVDMIRLDFGAAPMGMFRHRVMQANFNVEPGFVGEVVNEVMFYGNDENGNPFLWQNADRNNWYGDRGAYIVNPNTYTPVIQGSIRLENATVTNVINPNQTQNRVRISYINQTGTSVTDPYAFILLPSGIRYDATGTNTFTNRLNQVNDDAGNLVTVIDSNYNNTGQQLIRVDWADDIIGVGQTLQLSMPVTVSASIANLTEMFVFLYSSNTTLDAPDVSGGDITNSTLDVNSDNMNQSGNLDQPRVVSGNRYVHAQPNNITTQMFVKGDLDTDYSLFGNASLGGSIDYKLMISTTSNSDISRMTIYNVLPSVGDLGITDNQARGTQWQPVLTGPVVLPSEWLGLVDVYYSESKNPSRDDLVRNVDYTDPTTIRITDPAGAENPNWQTESQVTDWSTINSFKLVLRDGRTLPNGTVSSVTYNMQAPTTVDPALLDGTVPAHDRAAWNSFAIARDTLQAVEPLRVGVALATLPTIEKDVDGQENLVLDNRDQMFTWNVTTNLGNRTATWTQAALVDDVHPFLNIVDQRLVDIDGNDMSHLGEFIINGNNVRFEFAMENGSFAHLADMTLIMQIDTVIDPTVADEDLTPYILAGGIPNQGSLEFGNDGDLIESNIPRVTPPMLIDVEIPLIPDVDPELPTIEKDVNGQETFTLANRDEMFTWNLTTNFGNTTAEWTQAVLVDEVHPFLDILNYRLVDVDGNDMSHLGEFVIAGNTVRFVFATQYDSFAYLADMTLILQIDTVINADVTDEELMPYILAGGIPNQGSLEFGNDGDFVESNIPRVTPPLPIDVEIPLIPDVDPEDPTIEKEVNGQETFTLANRDEMFTWNVTANFGNMTAEWSRAAITDTVHPLLDIVDYRLVDLDGNDMSHLGEFVVDGNNVRFEFAPQYDSFAYLAEMTLVMQIDTVINADATYEDLLPYILAGGIPNQGSLEFGNDGDLIESNIPRVIPPMLIDVEIPLIPDTDPELPTVEKDVNGQETFTLANRDEMFTWNVTANFGNTTAEWSRAAITDTVHPFLDILDYRLVDLDGNDMTHLGEFVVTGNTVRFEFAQQYDSFAYLVDMTFVMQIDTVINADVTDEELMPYILDGGIPNQGNLEFGNDGDLIESNIPRVTPPMPIDIEIPLIPDTDPELPTVEKDVNGQETFTLANRDEMFTWNVTANFGNTTAEWTRAAITDTVHPFLDILDYRLVDIDGNDMSHLGEFVVTGNTVRFEFASQYDSFAYLVDMTLVMQIDTIVNPNVTDEDLAPYIADGGIPNQGSLEFGNDGDVVNSNIPRVIPPLTPDNELPVEPNVPGDLPNTGQVTSVFLFGLIALVVGSGLIYVALKIRKKQ